ncbi:histone acetyltransferase 1 [Elasticomyces elasticus]|nr:histone acetyltransferase 1 [Elasticomyces elasticus]
MDDLDLLRSEGATYARKLLQAKVQVHHHQLPNSNAMADSDEEQIEALKQQVDDWSSNTTQCTTISITTANTRPITSFQPAFTYPIFGEEESVFGYQDLNIELSFRAHDLRPRCAVSWARKWEGDGAGEVKATDIQEAIAEFLPESAFSDDALASREDTASWTPPGEKIESYERDGENYEIWVSSLADERARTLVENMAILVPLFIEGGTILQLSQDWSTRRWKVFLLYHVNPEPAKRTSPYELVGFGTSYRVFNLPNSRESQTEDETNMTLNGGASLESLLPSPDGSTPQASSQASPLDLPSRERLSQFLILPPYQNAGHGQALYNAMYTHLTTPFNVRELTIEDPNEAFDDLRDLCDLLYLRSHVPEFAALRINQDVPTSSLGLNDKIPVDLIIDGTTRDRIRRETKIEARQFGRLVEMHTLSFIPSAKRSRSRITRKEKSSNADDRAYYFWRLYTKQRLFIHNRDQLIQLEREERGEKLEAALDSVQEGYSAMLEKVEARSQSMARTGPANGKAMTKRKADSGVEDEETVLGAAKPATHRKRKVVREDSEEGDVDEDEDGDEGMGVVPNGSGRKKARMS